MPVLEDGPTDEDLFFLLRLNDEELRDAGTFRRAAMALFEESPDDEEKQWRQIARSFLAVTLDRLGDIVLTFVVPDVNTDGVVDPLDTLYAELGRTVETGSFTGQFERDIAVTHVGVIEEPFTLGDLDVCRAIVDRMKRQYPEDIAHRLPNRLGI